MRKLRKLGVWVPHAMIDLQRAAVAASVPSRHQSTRGHKFLYRLKNDVVMSMSSRRKNGCLDKQLTPRSKTELHPRKTAICFSTAQRGNPTETTWLVKQRASPTQRLVLRS